MSIYINGNPRSLSLSLYIYIYIYIIISVYESFKKWVYNISIHNSDRVWAARCAIFHIIIFSDITTVFVLL